MSALDDILGKVGLNPEDVDDDPNILNMLAANAAATQYTVGQAIDPANVTTDYVFGLKRLEDASGSRHEVAEVTVQCWNMLDRILASTSQRAEIHQMGTLYHERVVDLYGFRRLVSPVDNKTLNVTPLSVDRFRLETGRQQLTATVDALFTTTAQSRLLAAIGRSDDYAYTVEEATALGTDGFMNMGKNAAEWRKFILRPQMKEGRGKNFALGIAYPHYVSQFFTSLRRTSAVYAEFQRFWKEFSGEEEEERAAAKLMFESALTGWGYFTPDKANVDTISDTDSRFLAKLYVFGEQVISGMEPRYNGIGGLAFPRENVFTSGAEPEDILNVFKWKMSTSLVRASSHGAIADPASLVARMSDPNANPVDPDDDVL